MVSHLSLLHSDSNAQFLHCEFTVTSLAGLTRTSVSREHFQAGVILFPAPGLAIHASGDAYDTGS